MARRDRDDDLEQGRDNWGRYPGHPDYGKDPNEPPPPVTPGEPPPTTQPPPTTPPPGPGPAPNIGPFTGTFTAPPRLSLPGVPVPELPEYAPPPAFEYALWKAPSIDEALADPGYRFRVGQGEEALQRWAAAVGTLNDSGTAKALLDYGQNAATQEYRNVWDRDFNAYATNRNNALNTYLTNYQTQFQDPFKFKYQAALDRFSPQLEGWRTNAAFLQHENDMSYANAWQRYLSDWEMWRDRRDTGINLAGF